MRTTSEGQAVGLRAWLGMGSDVPHTASTPPIESVTTAQPDLPAMLANLDLIEAEAVREQLPGSALVRLQRLLQTLRNTLPRLDRLGIGSEQGYRLVAATTDYLPQALRGFTRLPRDWATTRPVDERGRTALMVLVDQLDLLSVSAEQAYDAVCRADADALVRHGTFMMETLGRPAGGDQQREQAS